MVDIQEKKGGRGVSEGVISRYGFVEDVIAYHDDIARHRPVRDISLVLIPALIMNIDLNQRRAHVGRYDSGIHTPAPIFWDIAMLVHGPVTIPNPGLSMM